MGGVINFKQSDIYGTYGWGYYKHKETGEEIRAEQIPKNFSLVMPDGSKIWAKPFDYIVYDDKEKYYKVMRKETLSTHYKRSVESR